MIHFINNSANRIIPARAGFTSTGSVLRCRAPDHPRSRGVYIADACSARMRLGSSPLARGLLADYTIELREVRIIPARAGFTRQLKILAGALEDHPRSRGVYGTTTTSRLRRLGSSPLARGLRRARVRPGRPRRIIPARAGFTGCTPDVRMRSWDHPRSRGVYVPPKDVPPGNRGSSPLARGLRGLSALLGDMGGIIPARAGFTPCRERGEHP